MGGSCLLRLSSSTDNVEVKALQNGSTHNQKASQPASPASLPCALPCPTLTMPPVGSPDIPRRSYTETMSLLLGNLDLSHLKSLYPLWARIQWSSPGSQELRESARQWDYEVLGMWIQESGSPLCCSCPKPI